MRLTLRRRTRYRLWLFGVLWLITVFAGPLYALLFHEGQLGVWQTLDEGAVGGLLVWGFLIFVLPTRLGKPIRRLAFLPRMAVIVPIILLSIPITGVITDGLDDGIVQMDGFPTEISLYLYVLVIVALCALVIEVMHIIGPRVLGNLLIGRYQSPLEEERVFLFVDLAGSTEMAQKLGDVAFQGLLSRFFFDIGETVLEAGGEIHAYIGDEVIVTWPRQPTDARPVVCFFAIQDLLARQRRSYRNAFGVEPVVRGALHGGPTVMAACGDAKRAIVYFGDTLNTTARLEGEAKRLDRSLVATADFAMLLELPNGIEIEQLGPVSLRGRDGETDLVAFVRPKSSKRRSDKEKAPPPDQDEDASETEQPQAAA
ncbi:MAG: adenylate/guanylate cyclase domain-containing protein [Pseudomonadota bacterium]